MVKLQKKIDKINNTIMDAVAKQIPLGSNNGSYN